MILPGALVIFTPILVGWILGGLPSPASLAIEEIRGKERGLRVLFLLASVPWHGRQELSCWSFGGVDGQWRPGGDQCG